MYVLSLYIPQNQSASGGLAVARWIPWAVVCCIKYTTAMRPDKKKKGYKGKGGGYQQRQQETSGTSSCNTTDEVEVDTSHKTIDSSKQPVQGSSSKSPVQPAVVTSAADSEPEATSNSKLTDVIEDAAKNHKRFSKRQVFSNWEKYAEPAVDVMEDVDAVTDGVDFEKLLQNPASGDGHFIFKSEKLTVPPNNGNLFALDLKLLSSTLSSIPFYRQLDLPQSIFSVSELAAMDKEAEIRAVQMKSEQPNSLLSLLKESIQEESQTNDDPINQVSTKNCLPKNTDKLMPEIDLITDLELEDSKSSQPENIMISNSSVTAKVQISCDSDQQSATQKISIVSNIDADLELLNNSLDNKLAVSESKMQTSACDNRPNVTTTSGEDLEAWLDSVLDD